jgi:Domain of unknown function (DUF3883)
MASVPLWVYKCNARNLPHQVAWGDWEEVFSQPDPREWGGSETMRNPSSLHILWEQMAVGDLILAYQTDQQAAVGLCEVEELVDYVDELDQPQREMILRPIERFPEPVKIHQLKHADPVLRAAAALRSGFPQTLYATTPAEAAALLVACGAKYRPRARAGASRRPGRGGGYGDPDTNKQVEEAAINLVRRAYEQDGWTVVSVESQNLGYDLRATRKGREEHLEVKGTRGPEPAFILTAGELRRLQADPTVRLCVVTAALSRSPTLRSWSPAEVRHVFELSPVSYRAKRRR